MSDFLQFIQKKTASYILLICFVCLPTMAEQESKQQGEQAASPQELTDQFDPTAEEELSKPLSERIENALKHQKVESRLYKAVLELSKSEREAQENYRALLPHRPNYFMPLTWQQHINEEPYEGFPVDPDRELQHMEFVFQFSFKSILIQDVFRKDNNLEFGYTNRSFWQAYNRKISAPFRDTNHEPEIMLTFGSINKPWLDFFSVGFNHQSNGQPSVLSRSWNRIVFQFAKVFPNSAIVISPWWRIPETNKADPLDPTDNDNPDIHEYLGYGDLFYLRLFDQHSFGMHLRNNFDRVHNKGSVSLEWSFPLNKRTKGFIQYFDGYGETLLDYDHYQRRIGIGIKLSDWL